MDEPEIDAALARLRAADPAVGLTGSWEGAPVDVSGRSHRTARLLSVAAAAVVVAAVAVAAVELHGTDRTTAGLGRGAPTSAPASPTMTPTVTPTAPPGDPKRETERLLSDMLTTAPVLPGATHLDTSPVPPGTFEDSATASGNPLEPSSYWTAPGTMADAIVYFIAHRPDGLSYGGSSSAGNVNTPEKTAQAVYFEHPDTDFAADIELQLSVLPYGGGVAVQATAQGVWIPRRDPATLLGRVTSVEVAVERGDDRANGPFPGAPTVLRTLTGADAQRLAAVVDGLAEDVSGGRYCPVALPDYQDTLVFTSAAGTARAVAMTTGCTGVTLTPPGGGKQVHLVPGDLDATVLQLLGLPKGYGRH